MMIASAAREADPLAWARKRHPIALSAKLIQSSGRTPSRWVTAPPRGRMKMPRRRANDPTMPAEAAAICSPVRRKVVIHVLTTITRPNDAICMVPNNQSWGSESMPPMPVAEGDSTAGVFGDANIQRIQEIPATAAVARNAPRHPNAAANRGTAKITKPEPTRTDPP